MEQQSQTNLTLADIASMINIIDAASSRGTFKPNEYAAVGELYNKLTRFLEEARAQLQPPAPQEPEQPQGEANA